MDSSKNTEKKRLSGGKIALITVALALLAGGGIYWYLTQRPAGRQVFVMSVQDVSSNAMVSGYTNRYSGVVEPQSTRDIQLDSSKKLDQVYVKEGDHVEAGQKLFTYSISDLKLELAQKQIDLERINMQINDQAQEIADLQKQKASASYDMQMEYSIQIQQAQTELKALQYELQSKQLEIEDKNREINNADVTSPISGTVKSVRDADNNDYYDTNNAFITIVAEGNYIIKSKVSEYHISELYVGQPMLVRSRVDEKHTWSGTVSSIDTGSTAEDNNQNYYGDSDESAAKYYFYVALENTDGLLIGQHVTAEASQSDDTESYSGILLGSYFINDLDTDPYIWVSRNGKLAKAKITIGKYKEMTDEYEIIEGITASDYIALPDESLHEGLATTTQYIEPDVSNEENRSSEDIGEYTGEDMSVEEGDTDE